ncbi:MAG: SCP2 sterol-binding domain-containing protein [Deltaproteobacteria bacterium]|jgi:putative sterol carrier protein|nr:SCP2 sterol-binding domain-containing protein [Deltaproteobacteria bacterium]MBW2481385.1 SCP2 sterol-binding domain-containing protein [Deltaproteobacteria bacterium]
MYVFSKEWIDKLAEALKNDEIYQKKAKGFDSSYQFVVEPVPAKGVTEQRACGLNLPQCDETWEGMRPNTDYVMTASYETYYDIMAGKIGATWAITTRKAKVKGNLAKLLKYTAAINRYVEVLGQVGGEFEGDFGKVD